MNGRPLNIAIVGCGVIGRSWAIVFARAGANVRLFDEIPGVAAGTVSRIASLLTEQGVSNDSAQQMISRLVPAETLDSALEGANYVQESTTESVHAKHAVFQAMDALALDDCILASSCSSIPPSEFLGGLRGERRMLIAHPFNPPHLIPLVELVPSPATADAVLARAREILSRHGQHPVIVRKPVPGFIGNRLQAAVVNEMMHLVDEDVASPSDIDDCLRLGLGLRWALMGPFETMDLNADNGIADYIAKFGTDYQAIGTLLGCGAPWTSSAINAVIAARRAALPLEDLWKRMNWRDRRLLQLREIFDGCDTNAGGRERI
ncbi:3-hydroxyacyl-CoA dehydrogenase [Sphingosinicella sp.]|uniref:3-hydroxyacyl-CoA dehydrogenase n=1 Tax=Sphingosinicella sp. TaxID=1917971 RepID=UPI0035B2CCCA